MLADWNSRSVVVVLRQEGLGQLGEGEEESRDDDVAGASSGDLPWARAESAGRASIIPFLFIIIDGALSNRRVSAVPDPCSGCLVMCEVCA